MIGIEIEIEIEIEICHGCHHCTTGLSLKAFAMRLQLLVVPTMRFAAKAKPETAPPSDFSLGAGINALE